MQFDLKDIIEIRFFKRDELTTDLICCEIDVADTVYFFHEEQAEWKGLLEFLDQLTDFDTGWFEKVSLPPFTESLTIAYQKS